MAMVSFTSADELNWSIGEKDAAQIDGVFQLFPKASMKARIPSYMKETDLTAEDIEKGYLGYYADDSDSHIEAVMYADYGIAMTKEYGSITKSV